MTRITIVTTWTAPGFRAVTTRPSRLQAYAPRRRRRKPTPKH